MRTGNTGATDVSNQALDELSILGAAPQRLIIGMHTHTERPFERNVTCLSLPPQPHTAVRPWRMARHDASDEARANGCGEMGDDRWDGEGAGGNGAIAFNDTNGPRHGFVCEVNYM